MLIRAALLLPEEFYYNRQAVPEAGIWPSGYTYPMVAIGEAVRVFEAPLVKSGKSAGMGAPYATMVSMEMKTDAPWRCLGRLVLCWVAVAASALAQTAVAAHRTAAKRNISALMLSDIHLDPFYDPAKAPQLAEAPVGEWERILGGPDSPGREQAYAALQRACGAAGPDTSNALFQSSLQAMRGQDRKPGFVTVSGDLIAHGFPCRFQRTVPGKMADGYAVFVEKTIDYVMIELRRAHPGVPVYAALGNNDSDCGDYRMDEASSFLVATARIILDALPASGEKDQALRDFAHGGYYSVTMAAPMWRTRLVVLNDLFMSRNYVTCGGRPDPVAAETESAWFEKELETAREHKQRVWVMGHIPPGVDTHSVALRMRDVCDGGAPRMFLSSEKLAELLTRNADVVKLGVFGHTHMDELRLLEPEDASEASAKEMVAVKMVPSITPVYGNSPAFTVAKIDPRPAKLVDYSVYVASNSTGAGTVWSKEYTYSKAYRKSAFDAPQVARLLRDFKDDPRAKTAASRAFIRYFYAGDTSGLIRPLWPQYVCALSRDTAKGFAKCACTAAK